MNHRSILALVCLAGTATFSFAANPPAIPSESIAKKKELLFEDNMDGPTHDAKWHRVVDTFAFENGMLKGTPTRVKDIPAQDGKGTVTAHVFASVCSMDVPMTHRTHNLLRKCALGWFVERGGEP